MVKNKQGGKHKHLKKVDYERKIDINKLLTPDSFNEKDEKGNSIPVYIGITTVICGGCRFKVKALSDTNMSSVETVCLLRPSVSRTGRITKGSLVLYSLRSYESKIEDSMKGDIIYIYQNDEIPFLKQLELIPRNVESLVDSNGNVGETTSNSENGFEWGDNKVYIDVI